MIHTNGETIVGVRKNCQTIRTQKNNMSYVKMSRSNIMRYQRKHLKQRDSKT